MTAAVVALTTAVSDLVNRGPVSGVVRFVRPTVVYVELPEFVLAVQSSGLDWPPNALLVDPKTDLCAWALGDALTLRDGEISGAERALYWSDECPVVDLTVCTDLPEAWAAGALRKLLSQLVPKLAQGDCPVCAIGDATGLSAGRGVVSSLHALAGRSGASPVGESTVDALVGLGRGLTPELDDLLCGFIVAQHVLGATPSDALSPGGYLARAAADGRTTALSATWLRLAVLGQTVAPMLVLLQSAPDSPRWQQAFAATRRVGSSTGTSLLLGATLGLLQPTRDDLVSCPGATVTTGVTAMVKGRDP